MPAGDITHPVPDLTGYITEGQVVLSPDLATAGVYPPVDALASLSRLMRHGAGPGRTRDDHLDVAAQTMAALARARQAGELADLVGPGGLTDTDRGYLDFEREYRDTLVNQAAGERRALDESLRRAWQALLVLPKRELVLLPAALLDAHRAGS
jgi:V/A-type H+-transporting ATPase subunit B